MRPEIFKKEKQDVKNSFVLICNADQDFSEYGFNEEQILYIKDKMEKEEDKIFVNMYSKFAFIFIAKEEECKDKALENARNAGNSFYSTIKCEKIEKVDILEKNEFQESSYALAEGLALSAYTFIDYFKDEDKAKKENLLKEINLINPSISQDEVDHINITTEAVYKARDLVNTPVINMNSVNLADEFKQMAKDSGMKAEVWDKKKIEANKMGGLLAVNAGSIDPPTFTKMIWKPKNAVNKKPIVLVGKGVTFDTGGLSLKPTKGSMDAMKSDMAGAAAVGAAIFAIAKAKLPVYVVAHIPATDNRPDGNAYTPGDVIKMHNGLHVEVLNTDAEGRMILADALSIAQELEPELGINVATLTGNAWIAIGKQAMVGMGNASDEVFADLDEVGWNVYERVARFPFWDEYKEDIKSDIADIKNLGGATAGAITAGKFLEHFTNYPFVHLDIAPLAFLDGANTYRPKGGSGTAVRLLFNYVKKRAKK